MHRQQPHQQRVHDFALAVDQVEFFMHVGCGAYQFQRAGGVQVCLQQQRCRHYAHAAGGITLIWLFAQLFFGAVL